METDRVSLRNTQKRRISDESKTLLLGFTAQHLVSTEHCLREELGLVMCVSHWIK